MASRRTGPTGSMVPPPSTPRLPPPPDVGRRRRRPSGEPPPLPRDLRRSGRYWAALSVGVLLVWFLVAVTELGRVIDRFDGIHTAPKL